MKKRPEINGSASLKVDRFPDYLDSASWSESGQGFASYTLRVYRQPKESESSWLARFDALRRRFNNEKLAADSTPKNKTIGGHRRYKLGLEQIEALAEKGD